MTYGASNFIWLLIFGWLLTFLLHQAIGGLLGLFFRGQLHKNEIAVTLKQKP
jgi:hypothetical protein